MSLSGNEFYGPFTEVPEKFYSFLKEGPFDRCLTCDIYLLDKGVAHIEHHDHMLTSRLLDGLDFDKYACISPQQGTARSTLILLTHRNPMHNGKIVEALTHHGIDIALREGNIRISPHLYNTCEEIDRLLS